MTPGFIHGCEISVVVKKCCHAHLDERELDGWIDGDGGLMFDRRIMGIGGDGEAG